VEVKNRRDDRPVYMISIAADLTGLHPRTLRIYEDKGLLQPARRNNTRLYSDRDLDRVRLIRHFTQELGLNLAGVRILLEVTERLEYRVTRNASSWVFERTMRRRRVR
jgi:MerR family transcriptional regulator/heat shock protein HspR